MVHLICQSQTTSTGDTKNLSEAVIGTRLVYGRTADSLAVVEAEDVIEPVTNGQTSTCGRVKLVLSLHVVASTVRDELEDLAELQRVGAVIDLGHGMSTARDHMGERAHDEHASDADNQTRDGGGRWLSIESRNFVLDFVERERLLECKRVCTKVKGVRAHS